MIDTSSGFRLRKSEQSLLQALEASHLREDVLREEIGRLHRPISIRDSEKQLLAVSFTNKLQYVFSGADLLTHLTLLICSID
jgi:hypothetical protein